ncbi:MAG TPA: DNA-processing protein DprA [Candidatus Limnocylindrales bacterium]
MIEPVGHRRSGQAGVAPTATAETAGAPGGDPMVSAEHAARAILAGVNGLGPVGLGALLRWFGSATTILGTAATAAGQAEMGRIDEEEHAGRLHLAALVPRILEAAANAEGYLGRIRALGLQIVTLDDLEYPERLRAIDMPPDVLFVRGDMGALSAGRSVAIVGTRRPSEEGRRIAARIGAAISQAGATVVSGLAVGIDGAAHAAVVAEGRPTVAVIGGGHAFLYPRAHERLAELIVEAGGAVVSELPPDTSPVRGTFPQRNRLISGLSEATVVVEAGVRSGALITAGWSLEQGRECFVVPGSIDAPTATGCLRFLHDFPMAARVVVGIPELLDELGLGVDATAAGGRGSSRSGARQRGSALVSPIAVVAELGEVERSVALHIAAGATTVDELVGLVELPVASVLGALTLLETRGLVIAAYGRYLPAGRLASVEPSRGTARHARRGATTIVPSTD